MRQRAGVPFSSLLSGYGFSSLGRTWWDVEGAPIHIGRSRLAKTLLSPQTGYPALEPALFSHAERGEEPGAGEQLDPAGADIPWDPCTGEHCQLAHSGQA